MSRFERWGCRKPHHPSHANLTSTGRALLPFLMGFRRFSGCSPCPALLQGGVCMRVSLTQLCLEFLWRRKKKKHFKEFCLKERKETIFRNKGKLYALFKNSIYLKNAKSRKITLPHKSSSDTDFTLFPTKSCQFYHHQFSLLWLILSADKNTY